MNAIINKANARLISTMAECPVTFISMDNDTYSFMIGGREFLNLIRTLKDYGYNPSQIIINYK